MADSSASSISTRFNLKSYRTHSIFFVQLILLPEHREPTLDTSRYDEEEKLNRCYDPRGPAVVVGSYTKRLIEDPNEGNGHTSGLLWPWNQWRKDYCEDHGGSLEVSYPVSTQRSRGVLLSVQARELTSPTISAASPFGHRMIGTDPEHKPQISGICESLPYPMSHTRRRDSRQ